MLFTSSDKEVRKYYERMNEKNTFFFRIQMEKLGDMHNGMEKEEIRSATTKKAFCLEQKKMWKSANSETTSKVWYNKVTRRTHIPSHNAKSIVISTTWPYMSRSLSASQHCVTVSPTWTWFHHTVCTWHTCTAENQWNWGYRKSIVVHGTHFWRERKSGFLVIN